jgi:hypothetical protein
VSSPFTSLQEGGELRSVDAVQATAGEGFEEDRHFHLEGAPPGQALTLVEDEVVADVGLEPGRYAATG